jgi:RimJ/RimL family protein N-acetyltransferase
VERALARHIARGTAWVAVGDRDDRDDRDDAALGRMWLSMPGPTLMHVRWLAVSPHVRGQGLGRALVERAIVEAGPRFVEVVTFGANHPGGAEAEAARHLYRALGFEPQAAEPPEAAPDGTPRELLVRPIELHGEQITLRPLRVADAVAHHAGEDVEQLRGFEFPGPASLARVEDAIAEWRASWVTGGPVRNFGVWDPATGALSGNVEVRALGDGVVNLSYLVFPEWRRRGIATDAARVAVSYARDAMAARTARVEVLVGNDASLGVVRRLRGQRIDEVRRPSGSTYAVFSVVC